MKEIRLFSIFGKAFIPKKLRPNLSNHFLKAGYLDIPYTLFGELFFLTLFITYFIYIPGIYNMIQNLGAIKFLILTFVTWVTIPLFLAVIVMLGIYFFLDMKIFNRIKEMEEKLGDYLTFVCTNLKGGMSFEASLWNAIRPEFGILAEEMGLVSKKVMTGSDLVSALEEYGKKYNSPIIRRSMNLIISEIESGGKISDLIDRVVNDLKKTRLLKQELAASSLTYIIFISAIIVVISPVLFALSYQLLQVMLNFMTRFQGMNIQNMPISFGEGGGVDELAFKRFSFAAISIISVFSSVIVSIIQKGNIKGGLKYIPIYWLSSLGIYLIAQKILATAFSSLSF